ncbi:hypothetical protein AB0M72_12035 [Nocardiopsis dassonvillei]|uniref:hypothetical protein n=1 Tax=Nocardiopsis dassonvillei TaxID=2014 RepID=UPI00200D7122|nr:hypothetical protein [Nocardiopsis dassonvillei]MCK9870722.1 hypothetical protein [Nocardiopsis dassonvillei]
MAETERVASEPAATGAGADHVGHPQDRPGGLREFPLGNGVGFFSFLVAHHLREIVIVQVTLWPHKA